MCTTMLSETIEYYVSKNSHAFVLYMDASKAFDRLCHSKLFDVLQARGMCQARVQEFVWGGGGQNLKAFFFFAFQFFREGPAQKIAEKMIFSTSKI